MKSSTQTPQQQTLATAMATLYQTFAQYQLSAKVEGCPCCVSDEDKERIHRKPLQGLTADDLGRYAFKAMTTWGSTEDFKHFLPRLLELITDDDSITNEVDIEVLLGKLSYAKWQDWPESEHEAVQQYLMALWKFLLITSPETVTIDEYLCGIGQAEDDLTPYLNIWQQDTTNTALEHLCAFVDAQDSLHKRKLTNAFWSYPQDQQIVDWLANMGFT